MAEPSYSPPVPGRGGGIVPRRGGDRRRFGPRRVRSREVDDPVAHQSILVHNRCRRSGLRGYRYAFGFSPPGKRPAWTRLKPYGTSEGVGKKRQSPNLEKLGSPICSILRGLLDLVTVQPVPRHFTQWFARAWAGGSRPSRPWSWRPRFAAPGQATREATKRSSNSRSSSPPARRFRSHWAT